MGAYGVARCPAHEDREPSLKISDDPRKADGIDVHCFAGCDWRDVKAALPLPDFEPQQPAERSVNLQISTKRDDDQERRIAYALRLWGEAKPINPDCLAWTYYARHRGLDLAILGDLSHALRWHSGIRAVVALMTDPVTASPTGIHRTFLYPDGSKKDRRMLGRAGVVRLSDDAEVSLGLGLAEGVEDGLAVLISGWAPVWAATSAGAISHFPILDGIDCLTVFADADEAGQTAAAQCLDRWHMAGIDARLSTLEAPANG